VAGCGRGGGSHRPRAMRNNRMACGGGGGVKVRSPTLNGGRLGRWRVAARLTVEAVEGGGGGWCGGEQLQ
jgi:hypothetical protein